MTTATLFFKRSIKSAASVTGAPRIGPRAARGSVNIFAYHRVVKDIQKAEKEAIYGIVISASTFRRHCEALKQKYDVVSLDTATHFLVAKRQVARPLAVITFDDGYLDFHDVAFPILNEFALPATVFLPTAHIGEDKPLAHDRIFWLLRQALKQPKILKECLQNEPINFADKNINIRNLLKLTDSLVYLPHSRREAVIARLEDALMPQNVNYPAEYKLLDWDMVRFMERKGISFGSHTRNHVVLPLETDEIIHDEISSSRLEIEQQLGKRVWSFAYPNGEYNESIRQATAKAGFKTAVTTENRINAVGADTLTLGRTSLCEESTRGLGGKYSERVAAMRLGI